MTYESLLGDFSSELSKLQKLFNLQLKNEHILNYAPSTKEEDMSHKDYQNITLTRFGKNNSLQQISSISINI